MVKTDLILTIDYFSRGGETKNPKRVAASPSFPSEPAFIKYASTSFSVNIKFPPVAPPFVPHSNSHPPWPLTSQAAGHEISCRQKRTKRKGLVLPFTKHHENGNPKNAGNKQPP